MHCYFGRGAGFVNDKNPWIFGRIQPNGDIRWSHGYTSRIDESPCYNCKVTFDDWVDQRGVLIKVDDPEENEHHEYVITKKGNEYCLTSKVDELCAEDKGDQRLYDAKHGFWFYIEPNGEILVSSGFLIRMRGDPCTAAQQRAQLQDDASFMGELYHNQQDELEDMQGIYGKQQGELSLLNPTVHHGRKDIDRAMET